MFINDQGCLLRKVDSGENHFLMVFFLRQHGLQMVLARRRSKAPSLDHLPDLFEMGELTIERRGNDKPAYLKEFVLVNQFPAIARRYPAFKAAARLVRFYEKNLTHLESFDETWQLLQIALNSFSTRDKPAAVLLKALYVFARSEGYPVREEWLEQQPAAEREGIATLISQPLEALQTDPATVDKWIRDLERYFKQSTDLLVPEI